MRLKDLIGMGIERKKKWKEIISIFLELRKKEINKIYKDYWKILLKITGFKCTLPKFQ